ncbi:Myotubularin-related protein 9 [Pseudolycoriella hygida]|uniref:Myotubularin-related protein 9 n=1 Tax=Pseudolycoriella hygida TaxID=35572 RepID=A0A9Q0MMQ5_9DIPT|nr:Myotubularin-related protein 9 [Pseudolycoriella hygida]
MEFAELILTPKLDGVTLHSPLSESVGGTLCITGHHLILSSRKEAMQELWLLHQVIDWVERKPNVQNNVLQGGFIVLKCKDLRIITLEINSPQEFLNIASSIEQLSNLHGCQYLYPFFYRPMYSILEDGYTMFRSELEFSKLLASDEWRLSTVNKHYSVCSTYGPKIVVPKSISDEEIVQSAAWRDGGRFPMLSYRHENGAILMRGSQPVSNQNMKRCRADEAILNVVLGRSRKGFIVDTWGKGKSNTETDQHYSQWRKVARPIGNLSSSSAILDSFSKFIEACNDLTCHPDKWLSRLDGSGWLTLVLNSLNAACVVAQCLDQEGSPVLVHGGKGLDTPLLISSLVQIILNPDCRTARGMEALIQREWIESGFPFTTRHKHSCYTPSHGRAKTSGSTFVLFLDCVHQLHSQFPCSFEFGTNLLTILFEHSFASQYGTFLGDNERDREALNLHNKTTSLWSYLNRPDVLKSLLNPIYEPNQSVIWPSVAPISITVWSELYFRWNIDQSGTRAIMNQVQTLITQEKELRSKVIKLRKQLSDLTKEFQLNNIAVDS